MGSFTKSNSLRKTLLFAKACRYEKGHSQQVARISVKIFDTLKPWHKLGNTERSWLQAAALLHDIGWSQGRQGHHKASMEMIIKTTQLSFEENERILVGLIARYHRKSLPKDSHKYYSDLNGATKRLVCILSSFLRIADGLDRSHGCRVKNLRCEILSDEIITHIKTRELSEEDCQAGEKKSDLLEKVLEKKVRLVWEVMNDRLEQRSLK
ncbi:MAG: HD domain-containing protein [Candidatus Omnitrophota bacterium]